MNDIPRQAKKPRYIFIAVMALAAAVIAGGGYAAQGYEYQSLLTLYAQSQAQLRANGISPSTPSAGAIASRGPTGATGDRGPAGKAGGPPLSWVYVDSRGVERFCDRVDSFDPGLPRYTCK